MIQLKISLASQTLCVLAGNKTEKIYRVSTSGKGAGEIMHSEMTPRGWHVIRAKIGGGAPLNTVFVDRRATGEIFSPALRTQYPHRDWILTRILWLSGTEKGKNRLKAVDTMRREIYVHGTPDDVQMGIPGSRGCIRMHNADIVEVYDLVSPGTHVLIEEG